ncbi:hypothetical protein F-VV10_0455 [Faustovirus]|nr:hypothetical protein F-VV10_0455 [Faustovirus]
MNKVIECVDNIENTLMPRQLIIVIDNLLKIGDYKAVSDICDAIWNGGYRANWNAPDSVALIDYILHLIDSMCDYMVMYMHDNTHKALMIVAAYCAKQPGNHGLAKFIRMIGEFIDLFKKKN